MALMNDLLFKMHCLWVGAIPIGSIYVYIYICGMFTYICQFFGGKCIGKYTSPMDTVPA